VLIGTFEKPRRSLRFSEVPQRYRYSIKQQVREFFMAATDDYTLAELMICAAAEIWRDDGEILATPIGVIPRLAASLCVKTWNPDLMITDGESHLVADPVPLGPRGEYRPKVESWLGYAKVFDFVWSGKRHALVGPAQIDRFGQCNISCIGDYRRPKAQMLGVRGLPGNSISHANSFFVPAHSRKVFVAGECDMVASIGYNRARLPGGYSLDDIDIRSVITDLCVMDFGGPDHQARLCALYPGVTAEQVQDNTGFELHIPATVRELEAPSAAQLRIIRALDPHDLRARQLKGNPKGARRG
jgi:glutaconate CoA-transferase subunit B